MPRHEITTDPQELDRLRADVSQLRRHALAFELRDVAVPADLASQIVECEYALARLGGGA